MSVALTAYDRERIAGYLRVLRWETDPRTGTRTPVYAGYAADDAPPGGGHAYEPPTCPGCGRRKIDCDTCSEAVRFGEGYARAAEAYRAKHGLARPTIRGRRDSFGGAR